MATASVTFTGDGVIHIWYLPDDYGGGEIVIATDSDGVFIDAGRNLRDADEAEGIPPAVEQDETFTIPAGNNSGDYISFRTPVGSVTFTYTLRSEEIAGKGSVALGASTATLTIEQPEGIHIAGVGSASLGAEPATLTVTRPASIAISGKGSVSLGASPATLTRTAPTPIAISGKGTAALGAESATLRVDRQDIEIAGFGTAELGSGPESTVPAGLLPRTVQFTGAFSFFQGSVPDELHVAPSGGADFILLTTTLDIYWARRIKPTIISGGMMRVRYGNGDVVYDGPIADSSIQRISVNIPTASRQTRIDLEFYDPNLFETILTVARTVYLSGKGTAELVVPTLNLAVTPPDPAEIAGIGNAMLGDSIPFGLVPATITYQRGSGNWQTTDFPAKLTANSEGGTSTIEIIFDSLFIRFPSNLNGSVITDSNIKVTLNDGTIVEDNPYVSDTSSRFFRTAWVLLGSVSQAEVEDSPTITVEFYNPGVPLTIDTPNPVTLAGFGTATLGASATLTVQPMQTVEIVGKGEAVLGDLFPFGLLPETLTFTVTNIQGFYLGEGNSTILAFDGELTVEFRTTARLSLNFVSHGKIKVSLSDGSVIYDGLFADSRDEITGHFTTDLTQEQEQQVSDETVITVELSSPGVSLTRIQPVPIAIAGSGTAALGAQPATLSRVEPEDVAIAGTGTAALGATATLTAEQQDTISIVGRGEAALSVRSVRRNRFRVVPPAAVAVGGFGEASLGVDAANLSVLSSNQIRISGKGQATLSSATATLTRVSPVPAVIAGKGTAVLGAQPATLSREQPEAIKISGTGTAALSGQAALTRISPEPISISGMGAVAFGVSPASLSRAPPTPISIVGRGEAVLSVRSVRRNRFRVVPPAAVQIAGLGEAELGDVFPFGLVPATITFSSSADGVWDADTFPQNLRTRTTSSRVLSQAAAGSTVLQFVWNKGLNSNVQISSNVKVSLADGTVLYDGAYSNHRASLASWRLPITSDQRQEIVDSPTLTVELYNPGVALTVEAPGAISIAGTGSASLGGSATLSRTQPDAIAIAGMGTAALGAQPATLSRVEATDIAIVGSGTAVFGALTANLSRAVPAPAMIAGTGTASLGGSASLTVTRPEAIAIAGRGSAALGGSALLEVDSPGAIRIVGAGSASLGATAILSRERPGDITIAGRGSAALGTQTATLSLNLPKQPRAGRFSQCWNLQAANTGFVDGLFVNPSDMVEPISNEFFASRPAEDIRITSLFFTGPDSDVNPYHILMRTSQVQHRFKFPDDLFVTIKVSAAKAEIHPLEDTNFPYDWPIEEEDRAAYDAVRAEAATNTSLFDIEFCLSNDVDVIPLEPRTVAAGAPVVTTPRLNVGKLSKTISTGQPRIANARVGPPSLRASAAGAAPTVRASLAPPPLKATVSSGTPNASAQIALSLRYWAVVSAGTPSVAARLKQLPLIPKRTGYFALPARVTEPRLAARLRFASIQAGSPTIALKLKAPTGATMVRASAGVPSVVADIARALAIRFFRIAAGPPLVDVTLKPLGIGVSLVAGPGVVRVRLKANLRVVASAGVPTVSMLLGEGTITARVMAGTPSVSARLREPLLRGATATAGVPASRMSLPPLKLGFDAIAAGRPDVVAGLKRATDLRASVSAGVPTVRADVAKPAFLPNIRLQAGVPEVHFAPLIAPKLPRTTVATGRPDVTLEFPGGPTSGLFRAIPDEVVTRRKPFTFVIPEVANHDPRGTYSVSGLPAGLTFNPLTRTISGTTNAEPGTFNITVKYQAPDDIDTFPPVLVTATTNGTGRFIDLTFNEQLNTSSSPATDAFTVTVDDVEAILTSLSLSGTLVRLRLDDRVTTGQTVTVSYSRPVLNPLEDNAGNDVASFTGEAVVNNA